MKNLATDCHGSIRIRSYFLFSNPWEIRANPWLNKFDHEVVVVRLGHFAAVELAGPHLGVVAEIADEDFAVDLRGVHLGAAFPQQFGFCRRSLEQKVEPTANQSLFPAPADLLLDLHQLAASALDLCVWKLAAKRVAGSA